METSLLECCRRPVRRSIAGTSPRPTSASRGASTAARAWIWAGVAASQRRGQHHLPDGLRTGDQGKIFSVLPATHDIPNYNPIYGRDHCQPEHVGRSGRTGTSSHAATWTKLWPTKLPVTSIGAGPRGPKGNRTLYAALFEGGVYRSRQTMARRRQCKKRGPSAAGKSRRACCRVGLPSRMARCWTS